MTKTPAEIADEVALHQGAILNLQPQQIKHLSSNIQDAINGALQEQGNRMPTIKDCEKFLDSLKAKPSAGHLHDWLRHKIELRRALQELPQDVIEKAFKCTELQKAVDLIQEREPIDESDC